MSTPSGLFRGSRALLAAAKSTAARSAPAAAATSTKVTPTPAASTKVTPAPAASTKVTPAPAASTKVTPAPAASTKVTPAPAASTKITPAPAASEGIKEKKGAALTKAVPTSPALQSFVGSPEISRVQASKKIWEYIKLHNLQNPLDKREIFCDATLTKLFDGRDKVGMLEITKLLSPHFVKN